MQLVHVKGRTREVNGEILGQNCVTFYNFNEVEHKIDM